MMNDTLSKARYPHADVEIIVSELLANLDDRMPGAVDGFYLMGSIALDDYRPGSSDIDFVAVVRPDADLSSLDEIHLGLSRKYPAINCDGIYLLREELASAPRGSGPAAREGKVILDSRDERHPITWLTLLRHGAVVRGEKPKAHWIAADVEAAVQYSRDNLQSYWRPWVDRRRDQMPDISDWDVVWGALGVSRLHAAITTARILSKTAAGEYALELFPEKGAILREALRLRRGLPQTQYSSELRRGDDLLQFMAAIIDDADR